MLGIPAMPVLAQHRSANAELFEALATVLACAARNEIMEAHAISNLHIFHAAANLLNGSRDLMSERQR